MGGVPSAHEIFDEIVPRFIDENPDFPPQVDAVLCVEVTGEGGGSWTVDLRQPPEVREGLTDDARCTIRLDAALLTELLENGSTRAWLDAFKQRRLEFSGHLPTAFKLERMFASVGEEQDSSLNV